MMKYTFFSPVTGRLIAAGLVLFGAVESARAQWVVVHLHPAGEGYSRAVGVSDGQQVGAGFTGNDHAFVWSGTAESAVNLTPAWFPNAQAVCVSSGVQGGAVDVGSQHACIWTGTPGSIVDLHPPAAVDAFTSQVWGIDGGLASQVGYVYFINGPHAALWTGGTAASWVDLHPAASQSSEAFAVSGGRQGGRATSSVTGAIHAGLWSGTAASWVDLHPPGSTLGSSSAIFGMHGDQQVGYTNGTPGAAVDRATLWTGTAASAVSLQPPSLGGTSMALAAHEGQQAGWVQVDGEIHAALWSGTGASWVDLNAFLSPVEFARSQALGIWHDAQHTYVVGFADRAAGQGLGFEAVMWVGPRPGAGCPADIGQAGGVPGSDGMLDNNEFVVFIDYFFALNSIADRGMAGGFPGTDGNFDNNDFIVFINQFFDGCP